MISGIVFFRNVKQDDLFTNVSISLDDNTYASIIEVAKKANEILILHKIVNIDTTTDIEDAKKRWNSAASNLMRGGRRATSFIFIIEIFGLPLQMFMADRESLYCEFNKIAQTTHITTTITSDNQMKSVKYGYYVAGPNSEQDIASQLNKQNDQSWDTTMRDLCIPASQDTIPQRHKKVIKSIEYVLKTTTKFKFLERATLERILKDLHDEIPAERRIWEAVFELSRHPAWTQKFSPIDNGYYTARTNTTDN